MAAMTNEQARWMTASRWALLTGVATLAVMLVGLLEGANLIAWLYGSEFTGAAPALMWLLPGIVFLSVHTILMHYYYAIGTPAITILAPFCGFVLNVALNLLLIPSFGIVGSALASTMAYGAMLVLTAGHFVLYAKPAATGATTTLDA
jgi:O-antigen/teichoic acid export membrane protein